MSNRLYLGSVVAGEADDDVHGLGVDFNHNPQNLSLVDYSRFKYGDGRIASIMGSLMVDQFIDPICAGTVPLSVTSSAYKVAPPASKSLQDAFVSELRNRLGYDAVDEFKINRANLTDGDYASMSADARRLIMNNNGLTLPRDTELEGRRILVIDDICVTGSHEVMVDKCLRGFNPMSIYYGYLLLVDNGIEYPKVESVINSKGVISFEDALGIALDDNFIPNARFCKFLLSQSAEDIDKFKSLVDPEILEIVRDYVLGDELHEMDSYKRAAEFLLA
jgi:hypothetical protein